MCNPLVLIPRTKKMLTSAWQWELQFSLKARIIEKVCSCFSVSPKITVGRWYLETDFMILVEMTDTEVAEASVTVALKST